MMERDELTRQLDPNNEDEIEISDLSAAQRQSVRQELRKRLQLVKKAIAGDEPNVMGETGDEVFDRWERELEAGRMPEGFEPVPVAAPKSGKPRG